MNEKATDRTNRIIGLLQEKVRLEPVHRRIFYTVFGFLWGSGALWLLIEWFKDPDLGGARTRLQTFSMKVHGAAMLVYLAMLGSLLTHIRRATALKANRLSGFSTLGLNGILALSGWLLYYASEDAFRQWSSTIHWTIGLASLPLLGAHVLLGRGWATRRTDGNNESLHKRKGLPSLNRGEKHRRQHG